MIQQNSLEQFTLPTRGRFEERNRGKRHRASPFSRLLLLLPFNSHFFYDTRELSSFEQLVLNSGKCKVRIGSIYLPLKYTHTESTTKFTSHATTQNRVIKSNSLSIRKGVGCYWINGVEQKSFNAFTGSCLCYVNWSCDSHDASLVICNMQGSDTWLFHIFQYLHPSHDWQVAAWGSASGDRHVAWFHLQRLRTYRFLTAILMIKSQFMFWLDTDGAWRLMQKEIALQVHCRSWILDFSI